MRGIVLAGGMGTRLLPMTKVTNKHLLPVYDKPMIYYPLNTLKRSGIKDIMIITGPEFSGDFINLLGNGEELGLNLTYKFQKEAGGIAQALGLCKDFAQGESICVILGDNIFDEDFAEDVSKFGDEDWQITGAKVFLKEVEDPERFGVAVLDPEKGNRIKEIEEKPKVAKSNLAVVGLYLYDHQVWDVIKDLKPSGRGELEITDVNNWYIENDLIDYRILTGFWSDAGKPESLFRASEHFKNQGGC